jgi:hypothetical protein
MVRLSLAEKIRRADERGWSVERIAATYAVTNRAVRRVLWEKDNKEHRRKWDAARKRDKYWNDPKVRSSLIKYQRKRRRLASEASTPGT